MKEAKYKCMHSACLKKCVITAIIDEEDSGDIPPFLCPWTNIPKKWIEVE